MLLLHERWFVDSSLFPVRWETLAEPPALYAVLAAAGATVLARLVWRATGRRPVIPGPFALGADRVQLAILYGIAPLILSLHVAVPLVVSGVQLQLFAPNLVLGGPGTVPIRSLFGAIAALAEIGLGLALLYGAFTRLAAALLAALWVAAALRFGPVLLLEQAVYLGIAGMLAIAGRGAFGIDALLHPRLVRPPRLPLRHAITALRVGTGLSLATLALTEKLANLPLGLAFLQRYPINFTAALGMPLDDRTFLLCAGAVELTAGLLLLTNTYVRLGIVALWFPFNLTLAAFGWRELVGHLPIYGAMAVLAVWGAGDAADEAALRRGLEQRPSLAPRGPDEPPRVAPT
jgi:uncharacterized membrane protein YphA (DoxX/SURF4 family)